MKIILISLFLMTLNAFAENQIFRGSFEMDRGKSSPTCLLNDRGVGTFESKEENHLIKFKFQDDSFYVMDNINQGKIKFNSCFSDGIIGYSETATKGNVITDTTTYLKPGVLCQGGRVNYITVNKWEMKDNTFKQNDCVYTRVNAEEI